MNINNNIKKILECILFPSKKVNTEKLKQAISNKAILITGASYGIGESVAYQLAHEGVILILVARTEEKLTYLKKQLEKRRAVVYIYPADLYDAEQVDALLKYIAGFPFPIHIFINNAGKSIHRSIMDSLDRFHDFSRTISLNYLTPVKLTLGLLPDLMNSRGQIINISALNVLLCPAPYWAAYQASKAAFDNWFRCALPELRAEGVICSSIYFPLVRTRMIKPTRIYDNMPAMQPGQAARIVCKTIIRKSRIYRPWWAIFPVFLSFIFRRQWEIFSSYLIRTKNA